MGAWRCGGERGYTTKATTKGKAVTHIPEVVTGLIGCGLIVWAFCDSIRYNRRQRGA